MAEQKKYSIEAQEGVSVLDNVRYREMKLKKGTYLAENHREYPEDDPFLKLVPVKKVRNLVFDENYPYLNRKGFSYWFNHGINYAIAHLLCPLVNYIKNGMKVKGKENMRKNKFKNGAITICNHVYRWDAISVVTAAGWREVWIPVFGDQLMTKDHWFIKYFCTIPVPQTRGGMRKFEDAFDTLNAEKKWFHVFPESCRWEMYQPIRPFKKGAFTWAYKYDKPIIPCAISYRPRHGFWKLFGDQTRPLMQLNIGAPIYPDKTKPRKEEVMRLLKESHAAMVRLAGIEYNPWPDYIDD